MWHFNHDLKESALVLHMKWLNESNPGLFHSRTPPPKKQCMEDRKEQKWWDKIIQDCMLKNWELVTTWKFLFCDVVTCTCVLLVVAVRQQLNLTSLHQATPLTSIHNHVFYPSCVNMLITEMGDVSTAWMELQPHALGHATRQLSVPGTVSHWLVGNSAQLRALVQLTWWIVWARSPRPGTCSWLQYGHHFPESTSRSAPHIFYT